MALCSFLSPTPTPESFLTCVKDGLSQESLPETREGCLGTFMPQGHPSQPERQPGQTLEVLPHLSLLSLPGLLLLPLWAELGELR